MSASEPRISEEARALLAELPLLQGLSEDARRLVEESFVPVSFAFGDVIFAEGDDPDGLYVLVSGSARVLKRRSDGEEVTLTILGAGDHFGEQALLDESSRSATVRASGALEALRLETRFIPRSEPASSSNSSGSAAATFSGSRRRLRSSRPRRSKS
jgi:CRP-like cAMP-binding protein